MDQRVETNYEVVTVRAAFHLYHNFMNGSLSMLQPVNFQ